MARALEPFSLIRTGTIWLTALIISQPNVPSNTAGGQVVEFNFNASDKLPPTATQSPNSSMVELMIATPGVNLIGPEGMSMAHLAKLMCARKCQRWEYCHAFYFNATSGLCYVADQGQFETYWAPLQASNNSSGEAGMSYTKLNREVCIWKPWTSWISDTNANVVCNSLANRTRMRECNCPTDGASTVTAWCNAVSGKSEKQRSFIGWCQWSEWSMQQANTSALCGYYEARSRSRNCTCQIGAVAPSTIDPNASEIIATTWNWCPWKSNSWSDERGYSKDSLYWPYSRHYGYYSGKYNTEFTRKRTRDCGCPTATGFPNSTTGSEVATVYSTWCNWGGWNYWTRDCYQGYIVRQRSRSVIDCTSPTKLPDSASGAVEYGRDAACSWSHWYSDSSFFCWSREKRDCNCYPSVYYTERVSEVRC